MYAEILARRAGDIKSVSAYNALMPESRRQFVLLRHDLPQHLHWDFMIEAGQALATWRLEADPGQLATPGAVLSAERLADHRLAYMDYEGPISGGRGSVTRIDRGYCEILDLTDRLWTVRLAGSILTGTFQLRAGDDPDAPWQFLLLAR